MEALIECGDKSFKLYGKWFEGLWLEDLQTNKKTTIWEVTPRPENSSWMYYFTKYAVQQNNISEELA